MKRRTKKVIRETSPLKNTEKQRRSDYQKAELFREKFHASNKCKLFRIGWIMPLDGFNDRAEYYKWHKKHIEDINNYNKSEKHKEHIKMIKQKQADCVKGKITEFDLQLFIESITLLNPYYKYEYDVVFMTLNSGQPIYWRNFIEQCLLFKNSNLCFPKKPLPRPRLRWNGQYRFNELIIENIFPDTNTKDFDNKSFTKNLEELKRKLPGYTTKQQRYKRNFNFGKSILELDKKEYLTDAEKLKALIKPTEQVKDISKWITDRKPLSNIRQNRKRMKQYIDKSM